VKIIITASELTMPVQVHAETLLGKVFLGTGGDAVKVLDIE